MTIRVVDLFAGAGGFSEGARLAGADVIFAANHWPAAVAYHQINHPETEHACQDLHQIDWNRVPSHDLLLASPACQGHSQARSKDLPYHDELRSTAWAVVSCLERHRPAAFIVENVGRFARWELYPVWLEALRVLGYHLTIQILNATDFGVPQSRDRLLIVGHREREVRLEAPGLPRVASRSIIRWEEGRWKPIAGSRSALARRQFENGRPVHGDRFLVGYHSQKQRGVSLDGPIGTITTKDQWAVVDGDCYRMLTVDEYRRAQGFRDDYQLPRVRAEAIEMIGNAVPPPMAAGAIRQVVA